MMKSFIIISIVTLTSNVLASPKQMTDEQWINNQLAMWPPHDHTLKCLKSGSRCEFRVRHLARERFKRPLPKIKPYKPTVKTRSIFYTK